MSEIVINGVTLTKAEAQQYLDGMSVEEIVEARETEIREKEEKETRLAELSEWFNANNPNFCNFFICKKDFKIKT